MNLKERQFLNNSGKESNYAWREGDTGYFSDGKEIIPVVTWFITRGRTKAIPISVNINRILLRF